MTTQQLILAVRCNMRLRATFLATICVTFLGLCTGHVLALEPKDIEGKYDAVSKQADGSKNEYAVEITAEKGKTVKVTWKHKDAQRNYTGLGKIDGDILKVTYQRNIVKTEGKVEYTVKKDGSLEGKWEETNEKKATFSGTETLTRKK